MGHRPGTAHISSMNYKEEKLNWVVVGSFQNQPSWSSSAGPAPQVVLKGWSWGSTQQLGDCSLCGHEFKGHKKCRGFHSHAQRLAVLAELGRARGEQTAEPKSPWKKKSAQRLERRQISYKPHFFCNANKFCSRNPPLLLEKFTRLAPSLKKCFQAQSKCKQMRVCQRLWKAGESLQEMAAPQKYTQDWLWNLMMISPTWTPGIVSRGMTFMKYPDSSPVPQLSVPLLPSQGPVAPILPALLPKPPPLLLGCRPAFLL